MLTENLYLHILNSFSRFGPNKLRTIALYSSSLKRNYSLGKPFSPFKADNNLASLLKVEAYGVNLDSNLIATDSSCEICDAR